MKTLNYIFGIVQSILLEVTFKNYIIFLSDTRGPSSITHLFFNMSTQKKKKKNDEFELIN
jgi:hypothetical protein